MRSFKAKTDFLQNRWNLLAQTAALLVILVGGFWQPPPPSGPGGVQIGQPGHFFLTLTIGLMLIPAHRYCEARDTRPWAILSLTLIVLISMAFFSYTWLTWPGHWACDYGGGKVVIGSEADMKEDARLFREALRQNHDDTSCTRLIKGNSGDVSRVWNIEAIERRRWILEILHLLMLPVVAVGVICTIQAFYCAALKNRDRRGGLG